MTRSAHEIDALVKELGRHGLGGIHPSAAQLRSLLTADPKGPLHFVNLLAFHDRARYPAGHELAKRAMSGAEAYALYGAVAFRHVTKRGGRLTVLSEVVQPVIGSDGPWHQVATMEYPNVDAFVDMIRDPDYEASLVHRDAGLARTLVLATRSLLPAA